MDAKRKTNPLLGLAVLGKKLKVRGPKDLSVRHDFYLYKKPYRRVDKVVVL